MAKLKKVDPGRVVASAEGKSYESEGSSGDVEELVSEKRTSAELEELARELWRDHAHAKGDSDARIGKTSATKSFCGYLSAAVVDEKHGIVLSLYYRGRECGSGGYVPADL